jgi:hypothetical protein
MLTLVCPQPRVRPSFSKNQPLFQNQLIRVILPLALALATTACSTLNAGSPTALPAVHPIAVSGSLPSATVGSAYSAVLTASGGTAPYTFSTRTGQLPPGLRLNATTGAISGMPRLLGSFHFTIFVTDKSETAQGMKTFLMTVKRPVTQPPVSVEVSPASLTLAPGATHQFLALVSNASTPAVTWSATAGAITATGMFTAPKVSASTTVQLTAISAADPTKTASAVVAVEVASNPSSSALALTTTALPDATEGSPYAAALHASGGKTPYQWKLAGGSLPSGFSFNANQAAIQGITSQSGAFSLTASVTDASGQTVSRKLALSVSASSTGNFDGPAELPRVYLNSSMADTPAPGTVHLVSSSAALQSELNSAKCGDTISLQAGSIFTGSFVFPAKNCDDNHWIVVRTSAPDSALPPEGTRMTPCYAGVSSLPGRTDFSCPSTKNVLAKIVLPGNGSGPIVLGDGANHYRLLGLEVTRVSSKEVVYNLVINTQNGNADHIVLDRMWIHGTAQDETTRGVMLSGSTYAAVVDSFLSDFHCVSISGACGDSQAIAGGLGDRAMGPYKIVNNYLEAAGENIIFGGGSATVTPADIEVRRNSFFKPLTWMKGQPNFVGGKDGHPFIVKNLFELKNAQRVLLEGNVFENSWGGFTQVGFALLLTPKNPGTCPVCQVSNITIRYNTFSHAGAAMQIANGLSDNGFAAQEGGHYSIHDLVFDDMFYPGCLDCNGVMFQMSTSTSASSGFWLHDVSIHHITVASNRAKAGWTIAGPAGQQNFAFDNSIVDTGVTANSNAGGGAAQCYYGRAVIRGVLDNCWSHYTFANNVIIGTPNGKTWPAENFAVPSVASVGFVNWNGGIDGDYHLAASSPYKGKASDGKDPGADIDAVDAATAGVR